MRSEGFMYVQLYLAVGYQIQPGSLSDRTLEACVHVTV